MIKVSISRNNQVTNQGTFASQLEADAWLAQEESNKSFGKPAGFYPISQLSQEELAQEISRKVVDEFGNEIEPIVEIPAQYSVVISDISAEITEQKGIAKNKARIQFAMDLMAELAYRNKKRLLAGETTIAEIFAAEAKLVVIQRYLQNSSTEKAYQDLLALDIPELPVSEKQYFLDKINNYLLSEV